MKSHRSTLFPLLLIVAIDMLGIGLIFPVISPLFMETSNGILSAEASLALRDILFSVTMGIFGFFMFFGAPFCGDLSDRIGRKKTLLFCLLGTAFGFLLCGLGIVYKSVTVLLLGRALTGFAGGSQALAQAAIADISTQDKKAAYLSLSPIAACVGFVVGPMIGGFFSQGPLSLWFGFATPFFVAAILALLNSVYLMTSFKETFHPTLKTKLSFTKGLAIFTDAFQHKEIRILSLIFLLMQIAWGLYIQYVSLYLAQAYAFSPTRLGYFLAYIALLFGLTLLVLLPILLRSFEIKPIAFWSLVLMTAGLVCMAIFPGEWAQWIFALPACIGSSMGYAAMLALASNSVDANSQGWVMGIVGAVFAMAWLISGFASGLLAFIHLTVPFVVAAVLAIASVWAFKQKF